MKRKDESMAFSTLLEAAKRLGKDGVVTIDYQGQYNGEDLWEVRAHKPGQGLMYLALQGTRKQVIKSLLNIGQWKGECIWGKE